MSSTNTVTAEVVQVTPEMAKNLVTTCQFERQRPVSPRNIERLKVEMGEGRFIAGTPIFFAVLPDRSMRLLNGNHTMHAVAASGLSQDLTFIYANVPDEKAAAEIYVTFDTHKVRSWADAIRALGYREDHALASETANALGYIMSGFQENVSDPRARSSRGARFKLMPAYRDASSLLANALAGVPHINRRVVVRKAVFAVALETARYQPSLAFEFWRGLAADDGLNANDPRKALLRYLQNNPVASSASRREQALAAASGWNAYFEKRELQHVRATRGDIRILGTPWGSRGKAPVGPQDAGRRVVPMFKTGVQTGPQGETPVIKFAG